MKKLVTELHKKTLIRLLPIFGIEGQVTVIDEDDEPIDSLGSNTAQKPFFVEENIVDLDRVFALCEDADTSLKSPIRQAVVWDDLWDFRAFAFNIQKQREFGYPMTNIEYIYKKGLQLNLPIQLQQASEELGFDPDMHCLVITGKSEIGEMRLYQEEDMLLEYVFDLQYFRRKLFSKRKVFTNTHWHPRGYQTAMNDMIAFMKSDKDYFRRIMKIDVE